jgi:hypothetical protein
MNLETRFEKDETIWSQQYPGEPIRKGVVTSITLSVRSNTGDVDIKYHIHCPNIDLSNVDERFTMSRDEAIRAFDRDRSSAFLELFG